MKRKSSLNRNEKNYYLLSIIYRSEMKQKQIENLEEGRELDALIAEKVLGWKWFKIGFIAVLIPPSKIGYHLEHPVLYTPIDSPNGLEREHLDGIFFYDSRLGGVTQPVFPFTSKFSFMTLD
jgi:hypothetical protein